MYKLPQMAPETRHIPAKFHNVQSKFKRNEPKAKRVSFYKNGDYYDYGLHVPIQGHKHFQSLAHLCDFLTSKTKLPQGVRYIFTQDGKLVNELEDFEDGNMYVVSSSKHFESLPYGAVARVKTSHVIKAVNLTDDDVKYLRPASPLKSRKEYRKPLGAKPIPFQNTSKDTRVFTVINNRFHGSKSSILFNVNTGQSFEGALEDWGQSVGLRKVRRMATRFGREVRSLSQLKQDFRDVDVFYLEGEDVHNDVPLAGSKLSKKYDYDTGYPSRGPVVEWIHGYSGSTPSPNMHLVSTGELLYPIGAVVVLYDQREDRQRHYSKHTEDVQSVCVHPSLKAVASGQASGNENASQAVVHVWNIETLEPIIIVGKNQLDGNIITVDFSPNDFMLLTIESGREEAVTLWDWESDAIVGRSSTSGENITGGAFHPYEDNLMMTFGMHHLAFWKRGKDGFLARRNALAPGHSGRTISSWAFFPDGGFVVGDSSGFITIWNKSNEEQFYIEKEIRAHDRDVSSLLLLPGGTLLSGGRNDDDGHLRAWDTEDGFSHIASAKISDFGGVKAMCPQKLSAEDGNLFIGTKYNTILEGSVHRKFKIIVQGHRKEVIDLSVHSEELAFVTVDRDHYIYKWSLRTLYWNEKLEIDSISVAMYPGGGVIITGGKNGKFMALNSENGLIVSTITVAFTSLTVLSYSSDGRMLAVGCQDGSIYIYQTQSKGYQYKKISVLKSGNPLLNIDWSFNLASIQAVSSDSEFYELTLWNVKEEKRLNPDAAENIDWNEHTCTVGHNIIGIWKSVPRPKVVYLSCNRSKSGKFLVGGDTDGFIRVFRYPCKSSENAKYFEKKQSTGAITSVRFFNDNYLASAGNSDGSIFIWKLVKQQ